MNMQERHVIKDQKLPHFITAVLVEWIDLLFRCLKDLRLFGAAFCCEVTDIQSTVLI